MQWPSEDAVMQDVDEEPTRRTRPDSAQNSEPDVNPETEDVARKLILSGVLKSNDTQTPPVSRAAADYEDLQAQTVEEALAAIENGVAEEVPEEWVSKQGIAVDLADEEATDIALRHTYANLPLLR